MSEGICRHNQDGLCAGFCTTRISIFQTLSPEEHRQLVQCAGHFTAKAGSAIFREEDKADHIMIIHKGRVKLSRYSQEGREFVQDILSPGTIYGEQRLFSGMSQGVNATAMEEVSYCRIHRKDIEALILKSPVVGIKMLAELGAKHSRVSRMREILSVHDAKARLAGFLLHTGGESGMKEIVMARDTLSASVNLRHETVSRKLRELEKDGCISLKGHKTILLENTDALREVYEAAE